MTADNEGRPKTDVEHNWKMLAAMTAYLWKYVWKKKEVKDGGT